MSSYSPGAMLTTRRVSQPVTAKATTSTKNVWAFIENSTGASFPTTEEVKLAWNNYEAKVGIDLCGMASDLFHRILVAIAVL
ncbi:hypothetical protein [Algihabitans albus]|uniref:hypothetical protein n=1 Tax=Algihabitans albus TaxID=2164067 RepID=UPI0013C32BC1|nr:hypothetical protein [Algihabitans albus]